MLIDSMLLLFTKVILLTRDITIAISDRTCAKLTKIKIIKKVPILGTNTMMNQ